MNSLELSRQATLQPITQIAHDRLGIPADALETYGRYKAKVSGKFVAGLSARPEGKLILVTAMSPTPAGEGKTTTTIGLGDALSHIGKRALICLREPALGPVFGVKGGATGGGRAQVAPMEDINLHFTGDFAAIAHANNLLSALIDNHIHFGNLLKFDDRRITWRRVVDINDRALRKIIVGLGPHNGYVREDGFDIVVASEVMAIFCLSQDLHELRQRLGNIVVGYSWEGNAILASDLKAHGAMTALLKQAFDCNLVQTLENNPALIHGGPFANIAHGCNSAVATRTALKLADYVVTEAGFGADLGAEKFLDIKCRKTGLWPSAAVIVATIRALKFHGGIALADLGQENVAAVQAGLPNLERHVDNMQKVFGITCVVAINHRAGDSDAEIDRGQADGGAQGRAGRGGAAFRRGRPGRGTAGARGRRRLRQEFQSQGAVCVRRCGAAVGQDLRRDKQALRCLRGDRRQGRACADSKAARQRLRCVPDLYGEDTVFVLDRPGAERRTERPHCQCQGGPPGRRSGVRRGDLR